MRSSTFGAALLLVALLALLRLPAPGQSPSSTPAQARAISAVATFLDLVGERDTAASLRADWNAERVVFRPLPPGVSAETEPGVDRIELSQSMVDTLEGSAGLDRMVTIASWAATYTHEKVHTRQSREEFNASVRRNAVGLDHTSEVQGWGAAFQSWTSWSRALQIQLNEPGLSEARRLELCRWQAAVGAAYQEGLDSYRAEGYGPPAQVTTHEGLVGAEEALQDVLRASEAARAYLNAEDFSVVLAPRSVTVAPGLPRTFTARTLGGVPGRSYHWSIGGRPIQADGPALSRSFNGSTTVSVEVWDGRGRKVRASSVVTVTGLELKVRIEPRSLALDAKQEYTVTAVADGGQPPYRYQWLLDGKIRGSGASYTGQAAASVKLTVMATDRAGKTARATCPLTVAAADMQVSAEYTGAQTRTLRVTATGGSGPYTFHLVRSRQNGRIVDKTYNQSEPRLSIIVDPFPLESLKVTVVDGTGRRASLSGCKLVKPDPAQE